MSKIKKESRKVKSIQKYTFEITHYEDGQSTIKRMNQGFSVVELIGITAMVNRDLIDLFKDVVKPANKIIRKSRNSPLIHRER